MLKIHHLYILFTIFNCCPLEIQDILLEKVLFLANVDLALRNGQQHTIVCWIFVSTGLLLYPKNMSSRFSSNFEASASELLENLEEMFTLYNIDGVAISRFKYQ